MKKTFLCPNCGARNRIKDAAVQGDLATCEACDTRFRLPNSDNDKPADNPGFGKRDTDIVDMRQELTDVRDLPTYVGSRNDLIQPDAESESSLPVSQTKTLLFTQRNESDSSRFAGVPSSHTVVPTDTQNQYVAHGTRWRAWGIAILGAFVLTVLIWAGFMMAARNSAERFDVTMRDGLRDVANERTRQLAEAIVLTMADGVPDVTHHMVRAFVHQGTPQDLFVVRPDGTEAFNPKDWSTYKTVVDKLCNLNTFDHLSDELGSFAKRVRRELLTGGDARLQELGDDPCASIGSAPIKPRPPKFPGTLPPNILAQLSGNSNDTNRGWVEKEGDDHKRTLVVVHPIMGQEQCTVCHTKSDDNTPSIYGLVVSRTSLDTLDSMTEETRSSAMLAAAGVTLFAIVILLSVILLIRRRVAP